jgi:hypothetical protein
LIESRLCLPAHILQPAPAPTQQSRAASTPIQPPFRDRKFADSSLEEAGFELPVPPLGMRFVVAPFTRIEHRDLVANGVPDGKQGLDDRDQCRIAGNLLANPHWKQAFAASCDDQAKGLEQPTDRV